jgi:creatinine amidohydrolase/Fe(II)-dependent formamide hydrolase-like protein
MIEQSIELVADEPELMLVLQQALTDQALEKPRDHRGGVATDMFALRLDLDQAGAVYRRIRTAAVAGQRTAATRERGLGGFVAAWHEYVSFLERAMRNV